MAIRFRGFRSLGLSEAQIEAIIDEQLNENADILVGIDDPEVQEMMQVLKKAVAVAIQANNDQLETDIDSLLKKNP